MYIIYYLCLLYRHTFCRKCFNVWEKNSKNKSCPLCREGYVKQYCGKDLVTFNLINELNVLCVYDNCPWIGELNELSKHIKICCFNPKKLPEFVDDALNIGNDNTKDINNNNNVGSLNDDENENEINDIVGFNVNSSLKARLYKKNPELVMNVLRKGKEIENDKMNNNNKVDDIIINDDCSFGEEEYENILNFLFQHEKERTADTGNVNDKGYTGRKRKKKN